MPDGSLGPVVRKAVTDGLRALLAADPAFNAAAVEHEVEVTYGWRFDSQVNERVYTGRSRGDTPPASMRAGRNFRDEAGTFDLNVTAKILGGDAYDADSRAAEIGAKCEAWLGDRKSNQLGIPGLQTLTVRSWESDYVGVDGGTASILTYSVQWTARLT